MRCAANAAGGGGISGVGIARVAISSPPRATARFRSPLSFGSFFISSFLAIVARSSPAPPPPRPAPPSVYQPPNAVHCPECDVCVEGYDHHCPWMGTCIGSRNYAPFLLFNLAWLFYLLYAILWVSFVGVRFGILLAD